MNKVQCTFRLPLHIVELIDKQEGNNRTDKLLSLIGVDYTNVINPDYTLLERFDLLEKRVLELESKKKSIPPRINSNNPNMNTHESMIIDCIRSYKFTDGLSATDIANKLNTLGYLTVSLKPFTKGSVEGIIRRKL